MSARASFSHDSMIVKMPLPNSILLKDYLLDDLSSCSSNGFRSYPRRQKCCTKVRYLIEIDLNKHIKLPPSHKKLLKTKSKPKSKPKLKLKMKSALVLHKASAAVVNVFKKFNFSGSGSGYGNLTKVNCLSKHGFWKRNTRSIGSFERFNSFDESIKRSENMSIDLNTDISPVVHVTTKAEMKTFGSKSNGNGNGNSNTTKVEMKTSRSKSNSNSNSNSSASTDSYFTATSNSSTTGGSSKIVVAENDVVEREELPTEKMNTTVTATNAIGSTKKKLQGEEKDIFSPISVIDFPCDDEEDEVTSPFHHNPFYSKGCKQKLMSKGQRTKSLARLNPVRLEDRIKLSESRTHGWILESSSQFQRELAAEKKAIALLQLLKASMSYDASGSTMTERVLLGFFNERFIEGGVSNYIILQEAKDWINGQTKDMFESQDNKLTCIKEMEKGVNWLKYNEEETREVVSELEYEVFTSLVEETLLEFYL